MKIDIEQIYNDAISWIVVSLLGIVAWLVRNILTNGKKVELLEADLKHRLAERGEDRERMHKMEDAIERIEGILLNVAHKQK